MAEEEEEEEEEEVEEEEEEEEEEGVVDPDWGHQQPGREEERKKWLY